MNRVQLENASCFGVLLSQLGHPVASQRLLDLAGGEISPDFVVALLRERGHSARKVRLRARDLPRMQTPTLLLLSSGEARILESVRGGRASVEDSKGRCVSFTLESLARETRMAIDRGPGLVLRGSLLLHLIELIGHRRRTLAWLTLVNTALSGLSLLTVWVIQQAIGRALPDQASSLLAALVVAVVAGSCVNAWLGWLGARTRITLDVELVRAVNVAVLRRVLALPYAEHQRRGLGRLLQVLESSEVAAKQVAVIVGDSFDAFAALGYLLALTVCVPWMGVALAGFVVFSAAGMLLLSNRSARLRTEELDHATRVRARLHELIQGVATLKVGHAEAYGIRTWLQELVRERGTGLSRELTDAWLRVFGEASQRIASVSVLLFGARAVLLGELGIADLVYLSMLTAGFMYSSMGVTRAFSSMWLAWTHLVRAADLLSVPPAPTPFLGAQSALARVGPAIELSDVWFRHGPDQPWILKGYNLTVDRNEHFELRGETGSGKTTILRLIAGLYRPERGTVSVLGKDPWRDRSAVAYLPQHARLFAGSLRYSLQQLSGASIEPIVSACSKTKLADWLITLPMGLETLVSPGGSNISGGQRQWVVLTAAVASERPIVLLDEAMSQIDHAARRALSEADLFAGRTIVSVAHDR